MGFNTVVNTNALDCHYSKVNADTLCISTKTLKCSTMARIALRLLAPHVQFFASFRAYLVLAVRFVSALVDCGLWVVHGCARAVLVCFGEYSVLYVCFCVGATVLVCLLGSCAVNVRLCVQYDKPEGFQTLQGLLTKREAEAAKKSLGPYGRLYYLALPPSVYAQVGGWQLVGRAKHHAVTRGNAMLIDDGNGA